MKTVYDLTDPKKKRKKRPPTVRLSSEVKKISSSFKIRMPEQKKRKRKPMPQHKKVANFLQRYFADKDQEQKNQLGSLLDKIHEKEELLAPIAKKQLLQEGLGKNFWQPQKQSYQTVIQNEKTPERPDLNLNLDIDLSDIGHSLNELDDLKIEIDEGAEQNLKAKVFSQSFYQPTKQPKKLEFSKFWQSLLFSLKARPIFVPVTISLFIFVLLFGFVGNAFKTKDKAMALAYSGYHNLLLAKKEVGQANFSLASESFARAQKDLFSAQQAIDSLAGKSLKWLSFLPGIKKLNDQENVLLAAKNISSAGHGLLASLSDLGLDQLDILSRQNQNRSLTDVLELFKNSLSDSLQKLEQAQNNLAEVSLSSLPASLGVGFLNLKSQLQDGLGGFSDLPFLIENLQQILGQQRSKKYLVIFQNNSEMRATGGFIGSYAILDIFQGEIQNLFIDNVFNPDGQLQEKIMPPEPIQKISANWSMHDANWFADFPTSAKKVAEFYEATGGSTVDGVFALTPQVLERLLEITGPIYSPKYGIEINDQNFISNIQYKVEEDFNKEENRPKKILADLAPMIFDRLGEKIKREPTNIAAALMQSLTNKDMLFYFKDEQLQDFVQKQGWAGQLKNTSGDFLMFVNSNINGYKTDYVIDQTINHHVRISPSGEVFNTLRVSRGHNGGGSIYDWYNQVNSDYFRVYVPEGSDLLYASGQTFQEPETKVDYSQEEYLKDRDLRKIWATQAKTKEGIDIFTETGKTVFGGWLFTSPGEETDLIIQYKLPFKLDFKKPAQAFSVLLQKQPGQQNSQISLTVDWPQEKEVFLMQEGQLQKINNQQFSYQGNFTQDQAFGFVFK